MPDTDILVSELPDTIAENSTDLVMLTQPDAQSDTGYSTAKTTLEKVALKGLHGIEYETLLPKFASGGRNITDAINQLLSNLADDYSTSSTYAVGDCVIYNGKIYECITEISVAEAWNSSHWTQIKAVDAGAGGGGDQKIAETKSGAVVNFETSLELPLDELKAQIVAQQAGSGTPSPSNPRAISGFSSVDFTQQDSESTTVDSFTIQLGQTVYGGSVDAKSGNAYATTKHFTFSEAQYYGTYGSDNANLYYVEIPDYTTEKIKTYVGSDSPECVLISNMFEKNTSTARGMQDNQIRTNTGASPQYFYFRADGFADLTALNAFLANTPLQVVAELQTPTEITGLTPANFTTFAGANNIFADCGDVTVKYFTTDASDTVDLIKAVGGVKRTVLMDTWNDFANGTTITLSEDVDNFDELIIYASHLENNTYYAHRGIMRVDRETILWSISESAYSDEWRGLIDCIGSFQNNQVYSAFDFRFTDKRTIKSVSKTVGTWPYAQCGIEKIIGVKYN